MALRRTEVHQGAVHRQTEKAFTSSSVPLLNMWKVMGGRKMFELKYFLRDTEIDELNGTINGKKRFF